MISWFKRGKLQVVRLLPLRAFGFEWGYVKYNSGNPYKSYKITIIQYREYLR